MTVRSGKLNEGSAVSPFAFAVIVTIILSAVTVAGDACLKKCVSADHTFRTPWFFWGFILYSSTTFGWVYALKYMRLSHVGTWYSVSHLVMAVLIGWLCFDEKPAGGEIFGFALAIASLLLLTRYA